MVDGIEKDTTKLFRRVAKQDYVAVFGKLQSMREKFPGYRDDQLLMKLLCDQEYKERREIPY
jgi:hypothetical protein